MALAERDRRAAQGRAATRPTSTPWPPPACWWRCSPTSPPTGTGSSSGASAPTTLAPQHGPHRLHDGHRPEAPDLIALSRDRPRRCTSAILPPYRTGVVADPAWMVGLRPRRRRARLRVALRRRARRGEATATPTPTPTRRAGACRCPTTARSPTRSTCWRSWPATTERVVLGTGIAGAARAPPGAAGQAPRHHRRAVGRSHAPRRRRGLDARGARVGRRRLRDPGRAHRRDDRRPARALGERRGHLPRSSSSRSA